MTSDSTDEEKQAAHDHFSKINKAYRWLQRKSDERKVGKKTVVENKLGVSLQDVNIVPNTGSMPRKDRRNMPRRAPNAFSDYSTSGEDRIGLFNRDKNVVFNQQQQQKRVQQQKKNSFYRNFVEKQNQIQHACSESAKIFLNSQSLFVFTDYTTEQEEFVRISTEESAVAMKELNMQTKFAFSDFTMEQEDIPRFTIDESVPTQVKKRRDPRAAIDYMTSGEDRLNLLNFDSKNHHQRSARRNKRRPLEQEPVKSSGSFYRDLEESKESSLKKIYEAEIKGRQAKRERDEAIMAYLSEQSQFSFSNFESEQNSYMSTPYYEETEESFKEKFEAKSAQTSINSTPQVKSTRRDPKAAKEYSKSGEDRFEMLVQRPQAVAIKKDTPQKEEDSVKNLYAAELEKRHEHEELGVEKKVELEIENSDATVKNMYKAELEKRQEDRDYMSEKEQEMFACANLEGCEEQLKESPVEEMKTKKNPSDLTKTGDTSMNKRTMSSDYTSDAVAKPPSSGNENVVKLPRKMEENVQALEQDKKKVMSATNVQSNEDLVGIKKHVVTYSRGSQQRQKNGDWSSIKSNEDLVGIKKHVVTYNRNVERRQKSNSWSSVRSNEDLVGIKKHVVTYNKPVTTKSPMNKRRSKYSDYTVSGEDLLGAYVKSDSSFYRTAAKVQEEKVKLQKQKKNAELEPVVADEMPIASTDDVVIQSGEHEEPEFDENELKTEKLSIISTEEHEERAQEEVESVAAIEEMTNQTEDLEVPEVKAGEEKIDKTVSNDDSASIALKLEALSREVEKESIVDKNGDKHLTVEDVMEELRVEKDKRDLELQKSKSNNEDPPEDNLEDVIELHGNVAEDDTAISLNTTDTYLGAQGILDENTEETTVKELNLLNEELNQLKKKVHTNVEGASSKIKEKVVQISEDQEISLLEKELQLLKAKVQTASPIMKSESAKVVEDESLRLLEEEFNKLRLKVQGGDMQAKRKILSEDEQLQLLDEELRLLKSKVHGNSDMFESRTSDVSKKPPAQLDDDHFHLLDKELELLKAKVQSTAAQENTPNKTRIPNRNPQYMDRTQQSRKSRSSFSDYSTPLDRRMSRDTVKEKNAPAVVWT